MRLRPLFVIILVFIKNLILVTAILNDINIIRIRTSLNGDFVVRAIAVDRGVIVHGCDNVCCRIYVAVDIFVQAKIKDVGYG